MTKFRIDPSPTFFAPARITVPGATEPGVISCEWRHKTRKEFKCWLESLANKTDADALEEVIVGWDVVDSKGAPVPFCREALESLLDRYFPAGGELFDAYVKALHESRLGN
jgi:hypothetical protein